MPMRLVLVSLLLLTACSGAFDTRDEDFAIPTAPSTQAPPPGPTAPSRPMRPTYATERRTSTRAYAKVHSGDGYSCAIDDRGAVDCWGSTPPRPQWSVDELAVRDKTVCSLTRAGALQCWGDIEGWIPPDVGPLHALGMGYRFACALDAEDKPRCWGPAAPDAPDEAFESLAVGWSHACGLRADGAVSCWGDARAIARTPAPPATFTQLALGGLLSCALDDAGNVTCWGDMLGYAPSAPMKRVSTGNGIACGVREDDDTLTCWGSNVARLFSSPAGYYEDVSVGTDHACAVRMFDRKVVCWGADDEGQASPP
ncbi:MAG: hypothetical protein KIT84_01365 [Labilithrix sp.]|nr:hypothetical protein [Labilithrix sp.]MCW5809635.1 hypothetical protein [Labilithrix sp.]